jgi:hypothetical protein
MGNKNEKKTQKVSEVGPPEQERGYEKKYLHPSLIS